MIVAVLRVARVKEDTERLAQHNRCTAPCGTGNRNDGGRILADLPVRSAEDIRACLACAAGLINRDIQRHRPQQTVSSAYDDNVVTANIHKVDTRIRIEPFPFVSLPFRDPDFFKAARLKVRIDFVSGGLSFPIHKRLLGHAIDSRRQHIPIRRAKVSSLILKAADSDGRLRKEDVVQFDSVEVPAPGLVEIRHVGALQHGFACITNYNLMFLSAIGSRLFPAAKEIERIKQSFCSGGVCQKRGPFRCPRCTRRMNPCFFSKNIREVHGRMIDDIDKLIEVVQLRVLFLKPRGERIYRTQSSALRLGSMFADV